jgi:hypothetical protein
MALVLKDRVKVTSGSTGTGTFTLGTAVLGFQDFSVIGDANTTYYTIALQSGSEFEVGIGTVTDTAGTFTLSRDTILESSNSGAAVNFSSGTKDVFVTYPAERAVYLNAAGTEVTQEDFDAITANSISLTTGSISTDPVAATDIANKRYVDEVAEGLEAKPAVELATTGNLVSTYDNGVSGVGATLTSTTNGAFPTIDGVTLTSTVLGSNGVLVKNQTTSAQNGRYNLTTVGDAGTPWVLTRCPLCDESSEIPGAFTFVKSGTLFGGTGWVQTVLDPSTFVIGTDAIIVVQFAGAGAFTAGTGLTLTGNVFSITDVGTAGTYGTASQVPVFTTNAQGQVTAATPTAIAIAAAAVSGLAASATTDTTNASNITAGTLPVARLSGSYTGITGVGTLTAGTWNATTIAPNHGGTGLTSYTVGDIIFADGTTSLAKLAGVATGNALISGGVGTAPSYGKIGLTTHISGTLAIGNGGTGQTTAGAAINALLPAQTSQSGNYLTTDGTNPSWAAVPAPNNGTLTMNVSGTGLSGSATFTADQAGASTFTVTSNATSANTNSTIVARDASGNFSAGTITAALSGNAATATALQNARTIGGVSFDGTANINLPGVNTAGNQNTTGTAANVTGTVAIANGGTGATTQQTAINALAGAVTSAQYLRGNGTNVLMSAIQAADVPTLNQNTTGSAATLTTARTIGGVSFNGSANINLPGVNTAGNQNTTGTAANITGTAAVANGGTGRTTLTANNVLLGNGTTAVNFVAPGTSGNVLTSNGTTWTSAAAPSTAAQFTATGTGANTMPVGTTAQRPATPTAGMYRLNTTTSEPEWYDTVSGAWVSFRIEPVRPYTIAYLVVAGGGAGGDTDSGGGGAGGYIASTTAVTMGSTFTITVGAGAPPTQSNNTRGANGSNSAAFGVTAIGGGGGGGGAGASGSNAFAQSGGSGGGAGSTRSSGFNGAGTSGQGNAGGNGASGNGGGGGGGAGAAGSNGPSGNGGAGLQWLNGSFYAGGGGGGHGSNTSGGVGGGGSGFTLGNGTSGSANTGGGGGGGGGNNGDGGAGGSGIAIIRYSGAQRGTGGTVTSSGGFTIHTFTSSGTFTA